MLTYILTTSITSFSFGQAGGCRVMVNNEQHSLVFLTIESEIFLSVNYSCACIIAYYIINFFVRFLYIHNNLVFLWNWEILIFITIRGCFPNKVVTAPNPKTKRFFVTVLLLLNF